MTVHFFQGETSTANPISLVLISPAEGERSLRLRLCVSREDNHQRIVWHRSALWILAGIAMVQEQCPLEHPRERLLRGSCAFQ